MDNIGDVAVQALKAFTSLAVRRLRIAILLLSTLGGPHVSKLIDDLQIHMLIKRHLGRQISTSSLVLKIYS